MTALVVVVVAAAAFVAGWKLATLRSPGALAIGDRVAIRHGGRIVGNMLLTSHEMRLDGLTTATLESTDAYLERRRVR